VPSRPVETGTPSMIVLSAIACPGGPARLPHGATVGQSARSVLVGREEHAVCNIRDEIAVSINLQFVYYIASGAKGTAVLGPGGFTPSDGCTFMIRIDLAASPGLGEGIQVSKIESGVPMGKAIVRTGVMVCDMNYLLHLFWISCAAFISRSTSLRQNCQGAFSLIRKLSHAGF